jgi:hypothetical protein
MTPNWEDKIAAYYSAINRNGYSSPPAPPNRKTVTRVLEDSNRKFLRYMKASDIKVIHNSENCVAFQIPSDCHDLVGSFYVDFFVKQRLSDEA